MAVSVVGNGRRVSVKKEDSLTVGGAPQMMKGGSSKKATNKNLPDAAHPDYRGKVVPTIIHWAAGNVLDPFNIDERELVQALAVIWKHVYYAGNVPFAIAPTVSVVSKALTVIDPLATCLRLINALLSGITGSRRQQPLHSHPYLQVMRGALNMSLAWCSHSI
jgi:hypothetical protein